jgi:hypothetical protein
MTRAYEDNKQLEDWTFKSELPLSYPLVLAFEPYLGFDRSTCNMLKNRLEISIKVVHNQPKYI